MKEINDDILAQETKILIAKKELASIEPFVLNKIGVFKIVKDRGNQARIFQIKE